MGNPYDWAERNRRGEMSSGIAAVRVQDGIPWDWGDSGDRDPMGLGERPSSTKVAWDPAGSGLGEIGWRDPSGCRDSSQAEADLLSRAPPAGSRAPLPQGMRTALRLVRFRGAAGGRPRLGLEEAPGGDLVDLNAAEPELPRSMREFLEIGPRGLALAQRALESGQHRVLRETAQLLAPVGDPEKVICVGLNYHDHCQEQGVKVPKEPLIFSKFPSSITGPFDNIVHPQDTSELDWEVELAAIIGKRGRHIEEVAALEHVLGFTVANDVSARDWQMRRNGRQWLLGKTFDTFCPLGPAIVTREAVADVHNLWIRCSVNGHLMQDSNTRHLIFGVPTLVAWVSRFVTLVPGDILLTGTPAGVGVFRKPPIFLKEQHHRRFPLGPQGCQAQLHPAAPEAHGAASTGQGLPAAGKQGAPPGRG